MLTKIGRYSVTAEIGKGGFGTVYRAHDPTMRREVAIKVLAATDDASLVTRFRAEAATVGNLHHKNIVTVYEFSEQDGTWMLVMELLEGVELRKLINGQPPLSILEKVEIMVQVAEGLHFAHERGVVHRDIKPSNIMRLTDGTVKILDFGIARLVRSAESRLTQAGSLIGTVQYMAPEQFSDGVSDAGCDIWAYGAVFYEFLTGQHPFAAQEPSMMMYRILHQEPPPVGSLVPGCPPQLESLVHRMLAKSREQRIQSLDDAVLDLRGMVQQLGVSQVPMLLQEASRWLEAADEQRARALIRRAISLDPRNLEAQKLRERLQEVAHRSAIRPKIEELVSQADAEVSQGSFAAAISKIQSALRLDPTSQTLLAKLEGVKAKEAQAARMRELLGQAQAKAAREELTEALQLATRANSLDPQNPEAAHLLREVQQAINDRLRQATLQADLQKARNLVQLQSYDDAIQLLNRLAEQTHSSPQVMALLDEAQRLRSVQQKRTDLDEGIQTARRLLSAGGYEQAATLLDSLRAKHPEDVSLQQLLQYTSEQIDSRKKGEGVDRLLLEARKLTEQGNFEAALRRVDEAQALSPQDLRVGEARENIVKQQRFSQERQEHDRLLEQALATIEAEIQKDDLERAIYLSEVAARRFPQDRRIQEVLDRSRETLRSMTELRTRRTALDAEIARLEQLLRAGDAQRVQEGAKAFLQSQDDPRVREMLDWATTSLEQARDIRRQNPAQRRKAMIWAAAVGAPLILGAAFFLFSGDEQKAPSLPPPPPQPKTQPAKIETPPPVAQISIEPAEIQFRYQIGGPAPAAQVVQLSTGGDPTAWKATIDSKWYALNPAMGAGDAKLSVAARVDGLMPGDYSGSTLIEGQEQVKTLRVRLVVVAKAEPAGKAISKGDTKTGPGGPIPVVTPRVDDVKAKAVETQPSYPAPSEAVDCHAATYPGLSRGGFRWTGQLEPRGLVAFGRTPRLAILRGDGSLAALRGGGLPGCAVNLTIQPAADVEIVEAPSEANNFGRLVLRNRKESPVAAVTVDWTIR